MKNILEIEIEHSVQDAEKEGPPQDSIFVISDTSQDTVELRMSNMAIAVLTVSEATHLAHALIKFVASQST